MKDKTVETALKKLRELNQPEPQPSGQDEMEQFKDVSRSEWLKAGGDDSSFERAWPSLYRDILAEVARRGAAVIRPLKTYQGGEPPKLNPESRPEGPQRANGRNTANPPGRADGGPLHSVTGAPGWILRS